MMSLLQKPILYINSPIFIGEVVATQQPLPETVPTRAASKTILRQLQYIAKQYKERPYEFHLMSNETIVGMLEKVTGKEIKVRTEQGIHTVMKHDIRAITNLEKR